MKKASIVVLGMFGLIVLQNCTSGKKATKATSSPVTFTKDILPIMQSSCTPCHFPPDGKKEALNTYEGVKNHIGEVIARVKLPKEDVKFMPFKSKKPPLSDSLINVLEQWQLQNMPN